MISSFLISLSLLVGGVQAHAVAAAYFTPIKAIVLVQGVDQDAAQLFEAMNVAPAESGPNAKKFLSFNQVSGFPLFDLTCTVNKDDVHASSCTINVYQSKYTQLNSSAKSISFAIAGDDSWNVTNSFSIKDPAGVILSSTDKKLQIYVQNAGSDQQSFHLIYR